MLLRFGTEVCQHPKFGQISTYGNDTGWAPTFAVLLINQKQSRHNFVRIFTQYLNYISVKYYQY